MKTKPEGEQAVLSNRGYFPSEWKDQFGLPVEEHDRSFEVSTFKNFAIMDVLTAERPKPEETGGEDNE